MQLDANPAVLAGHACRLAGAQVNLERWAGLCGGVGGRKQWGLGMPMVVHSASPRLAAQSHHPRLLLLGASKCLQATCGCHCGHCFGRLAHPPGS